MTVPFTHLHTHTPEGSLLDGFMQIEKAIKKVKSLGMDALGVSDHGTMAAHDKFYRLCKEEGIHPVLSMEGYITYDKTYRKEDFDRIDFELDASGGYLFSYKKDSELGHDYVPIDEFPTKKKQNDLRRLAEDGYMVELLKENLVEGEELPTKVTPLRKRARALGSSIEAQGYRLCVKGDTAQRDYFKWFPKMSHLLMIAINNDGYQNLIRLNNVGQLEGFYGKPRFDYEDIKKYGAGLAATSSCLGGSIPQLIMRDKFDEAKEEVTKYVDAFDEFYLRYNPDKVLNNLK